LSPKDFETVAGTYLAIFYSAVYKSGDVLFIKDQIRRGKVWKRELYRGGYFFSSDLVRLTP
jgi:hypothetical protein